MRLKIGVRKIGKSLMLIGKNKKGHHELGLGAYVVLIAVIGFLMFYVKKICKKVKEKI